MVRASCCEKMGLNKGPWTPEEDRILINFINIYGHHNWRALPKQAGLLRCGKSCRLRWTNYLRPGIKRGNFTKEEEETIMNLHETLGNKWSAIATKLPGRTDNEIKNVWHGHLKKKVDKLQNQITTHEAKKTRSKRSKQKKQKVLAPSVNFLGSPQLSTNGISSVSVTNDPIDNNSHGTNNANNVQVKPDSVESFIDMDNKFWSDVFSANNSSIMAHDQFRGPVGSDTCAGLPSSTLHIVDTMQDNNNSAISDHVDFWFDLFVRAEEITKLPDFN